MSAGDSVDYFADSSILHYMTPDLMTAMSLNVVQAGGSMVIKPVPPMVGIPACYVKDPWVSIMDMLA
ncbi:unnamed protein product [Diplocarpon coronariae]|uniref:Uncharacterized protein n=1 Tax=Diplocarpon coronariae TaxID=2795749 RepID=A0A218YTE8_9HELO|nr:hypothetical protein B2J93_2875 [Marssonina coronariae]